MNKRVAKPRPGRDCLLSTRAAAILGAGVIVAFCAAVLTYLATGGRNVSLAWGFMSGITAFAGTVRFLMDIIG